MALIHPIDHPTVSGIRVGRVNKKGNYHLTASVIFYRLGSTLIDCGPAREWSTVRGYLNDQPINQILLTHHHEDHSGNAANIRDEHGATIYSHPNNHQVMRDGLKMSVIRRLTFGQVPPFDAKPLPQTFDTDSGHTLQVIHTPGHTNDLCCFYEANEGWLFTGDLYVSSQLKYMTIDENVNDWIASLERALALDFDTLFCAHRAVVHDGKAVLAKKLDFFKEIRSKVTDLHQQGLNPREITRRLLGKEDASMYLSYGHISKQNLILGCLGQLAPSSR